MPVYAYNMIAEPFRWFDFSRAQSITYLVLFSILICPSDNVLINSYIIILSNIAVFGCRVGQLAAFFFFFCFRRSNIRIIRS